MKVSNLVLSVFGLVALAGNLAQAHPDCRTECWTDRWGHRDCRTVCHGHGHHHDPIDDRDLAISASILAISATTLAMDDHKQMIVNAAEDAAAYIETGRMTGALAAIVQVAREKSIKLAGIEKAASLSEAELVDGILAAAEQALEQK